MYSITMQQIEIFLTVAEKKSFSEAANVLFITQPAVSKSVRALEKELDARLFVRRHRKIALTREGEYLSKEWRRLLNGFCDSIEVAHAAGDQISDVLHIGCLNEGFDYNLFLPDMILAYEERYPEVQVSVSICGFRELREKLRNGSVDVAFTLDFELEGLTGISQKLIKEFPIYILLPASHPLAQRESLEIVDLKDEVFCQISPEVSATAAIPAIRACERAGFTPKKIHYVSNTQSLIMAVASRKGAALFPKDMTAGTEDLVRCFETGENCPSSYVTLAWRTRDVSSAALRFIEQARPVDVNAVGGGVGEG